MALQQRKYTKEETALLGDAIYERDIRAQVEPHRNGEIVAIDVESGAWEIDSDQMTAAHRLEERQPGAIIWVLRAGSRYLTKFGAGRSSK
jgi:hypothetical protein